MQVSILYEGDSVVATAGAHTLFCNTISQAVRWCDSVCYGNRLDKCIFGNVPCGYPLEYCNRCSNHPMSKVVHDGG